MIKATMITLTGAGALLIACSDLLGCHTKTGSYTVQQGVAPINRDPADSPIDIGGGSIYGIAGSKWKDVSGNDLSYRYTATVKHSDIDQISINGVNLSSSLPPSLKGWVITLDSVYGDPTIPYPAAVRLCSSANCDPSSQGDKQTVYISVDPAAARFSLTKKGELRYHLRACDTDAGGSENPDCDFLVNVTFQSPSIANDSHTLTGSCQRGVSAGHCDIGIGKP